MKLNNIITENFSTVSINGILFSLSSLLLHNIIFIPVILAVAVSGMKLYQ